MTEKKNVLLVGLDPRLIDFSQPGYAPTLNADKVFAGVKASQDALTELGCNAEACWTDFGDTAGTVLKEHLATRPFDIVMIGAGIRSVPSNFMLFEQMINIIHEQAPQAKLCFNQMPADSVDAVKRWL